VLAAGRLVPIKGFDVLVAAVGQIAPESRPALLIVGDERENGCAHYHFRPTTNGFVEQPERARRRTAQG
jgi:hypothetical protein